MYCIQFFWFGKCLNYKAIPLIWMHKHTFIDGSLEGQTATGHKKTIIDLWNKLLNHHGVSLFKYHKKQPFAPLWRFCHSLHSLWWHTYKKRIHKRNNIQALMSFFFPFCVNVCTSILLFFCYCCVYGFRFEFIGSNLISLVFLPQCICTEFIKFKSIFFFRHFSQTTVCIRFSCEVFLYCNVSEKRKPPKKQGFFH